MARRLGGELAELLDHRLVNFLRDFGRVEKSQREIEKTVGSGGGLDIFALGDVGAQRIVAPRRVDHDLFVNLGHRQWTTDEALRITGADDAAGGQLLSAGDGRQREEQCG